MHSPRRPRTVFRPLDGILLFDKPAGLSSNQALQRVRHVFRAQKGGHTGSLDPLATGLLPVCFGEATKIAGLLLGARKAYAATAVLGATTDSDDADGAVLRRRPVPDFSTAELEIALAPLRGRIQQRAPIISALKQGGEPLYARARRGEDIEAPVRTVHVHRLELVGHAGNTVELHIECGSGTYVRSLVRDMGESLGCGAHVATLRRLWVDLSSACPAPPALWPIPRFQQCRGRAEKRCQTGSDAACQQKRQLAPTALRWPLAPAPAQSPARVHDPGSRASGTGSDA